MSAELTPRAKLQMLQSLLATTPPTTGQKVRLATVSPAATPAKRLSGDERRLLVARALQQARPNHQFHETVQGRGCDQCGSQSPFRSSMLDHPILIQEEP